MSDEVPSIRREVCLDKGGKVVIVACINYRVPKDAGCRNKGVPMSYWQDQNKKKRGPQGEEETVYEGEGGQVGEFKEGQSEITVWEGSLPIKLLISR